MDVNHLYGQKGLDKERYEMNTSYRRYDIDSSAPSNYEDPKFLGPENRGHNDDGHHYETVKPGAANIQPSIYTLPTLPGEGTVPPVYSVNRIVRKADLGLCSKKRIFKMIILFNIILLVIVLITIGISAFNFSANSNINAELTSINEKVDMLEKMMRVNFSFVMNYTTRMNYTRENLFQNCYDDVVSCRITQHHTNPYWYLCYTPSRSINITVS